MLYDGRNLALWAQINNIFNKKNNSKRNIYIYICMYLPKHNQIVQIDREIKPRVQIVTDIFIKHRTEIRLVLYIYNYYTEQQIL